ncbi:DISP complex protein LRCH3-like [Penaeus monodon]|uniref:DISP complex protein LRCH3-like n=1 Tax=Penaeus monodon TaxID=6687 RepID=UPI0018A76FBA|nr:DISP complex protein LRCH3-like [Penaeus monodon]
MAGAGGPHSANSPCNLSRSLDRILVDAQATCELKLSGRKLKEYPKGASKYNLSDTVLAGTDAWISEVLKETVSFCLNFPKGLRSS